MFRYVPLTVLALAGCVAAATEAAAAAAAADDAHRLPADVRPVSYELSVATDLALFTFAGQVRVTVRADRPTCRVTMNAAADLRVTDVRVTDRETGDRLTVAGYRATADDERLTVELNDTERCLARDREYVVDVEYDARLRDDMAGYYRSSYAEYGREKWLAVTKFEPTHARKAFPCFDEPAIKAPFYVSIKRRSDQISLSNMPLLRSKKIQNTSMYWDHYQRTPPMSTYLVAFFVGEFYALKTRNVAVYARQSYVFQAEYAARKSSKMLEAMEYFTGVDYPLPKLDLLAIPDFKAGAMENWGLNTYRERLLLVTNNSKTKIKEYVTTVVQHELSHQWFGDLVTCAWWDYLWLNEGFATFFEYFATKMVEPNWRLEDVFVHEVHQEALEYDQKPTHPISGSVNTSAQIGAMFDDISYSKAGAVLRMLMYTVTEANFRQALNAYLTNNENGAATPKQLWTAFESVLSANGFDLGANVTVTEFMKSWTEQAGYPLLTVTRENNSLVVVQERFLISAIANETVDTAGRWIVGLTYTTADENDFDAGVSPPNVWLKDRQTALPLRNDSRWYIFNLQSVGFYRVDYDEDNWNALIGQLDDDHGAIHVLNRAQLIDDAFALASVGRTNYGRALNLTEYLKKERDVMPWHTAKRELDSLVDRMRRCPHGYKYLKMYVGHLSGFAYSMTEDRAVLYNDADHSVMTGWNAFSSWACHAGNEDCAKSALTYYRAWRRGVDVPGDIRDAAFCAGVKTGNADDWHGMLDVYVNSASASDRQSAQLALACTNDSALLAKYLHFVFDGHAGPIRPQDHKVIYQTLAKTPSGVAALIEFLTGQWNRTLNDVVNGEQVVTSVYALLASKVAGDDEIAKIDGLRRDPSVPERIRNEFNSSYAAVDENLAWFRAYHRDIGRWAETYVDEHGLDVHIVVDETSTAGSPESRPDPSGRVPPLHGRTVAATIVPLTVLVNAVRSY